MNTIQLEDKKQYFLISNGNGIKENGTYNSKISFDLPRFITKERNILYHTIKLIHAEIPYSFYIINESNNKLIYINSFNIIKTIIIESGNYNSYTLQNLIKSEILENGDIIDITLNNTTGKYTMSSISLFKIDGISSTINSIIGITFDIYTSIYDGNNYVINYPFQVNLLGTKNIYLKCSLILDNYNTQGNNQTLSCIAVNVPPYGIILYSNISDSETIVKNSQTNNFNIEILDDDNQLINFNNQNWAITIEIKTVLLINNYNISLSEYLNI